MSDAARTSPPVLLHAHPRPLERDWKQVSTNVPVVRPNKETRRSHALHVPFDLRATLEVWREQRRKTHTRARTTFGWQASARAIGRESDENTLQTSGALRKNKTERRLPTGVRSRDDAERMFVILSIQSLTCRVNDVCVTDNDAYLLISGRRVREEGGWGSERRKDNDTVGPQLVFLSAFSFRFVYSTQMTCR